MKTTGGKGKRRVSDIEYLAIQNFNNKLVIVAPATLTAVGNKLSYTVTGGKDAYIAKAYIVMTTLRPASGFASTSGGQDQRNQIVAKLSTGTSGSPTQRAKTQIGMATKANSSTGVGGSGSGYGTTGDGIFHSQVGRKVVAGDVIEIEVTEISDGSAEGEAHLELIEVNTGTTPAS